MKGYTWTTETHVFITESDGENIILSVKSRISETPACKFPLNGKDSEGLRDILWAVRYDMEDLKPESEKEVKDV